VSHTAVIKDPKTWLTPTLTHTPSNLGCFKIYSSINTSANSWLPHWRCNQEVQRSPLGVCCLVHRL